MEENMSRMHSGPDKNSRRYRVLIRAFFLFLSFALFAPPGVRNSSAAPAISVTVNGVNAAWSDVLPYMRLARLMVPIGSFGNALGAELKWDADKQEAFIYYKNRYCWVQVSNLTMYHGTYIADNNGGKLLADVNPLELPVRPELINNRLVTPLAALVQGLGGQLEWNEGSRSAAVTIHVPQEIIDPTGPKTEEQPPAPEPQGYYELLDINQALTRYQNDDPFVLVQFDNNLPSAAMYDMLKAAADIKVKIYGIDIQKENAALFMPAGFESDGEVLVHLINGYERVRTISDPNYAECIEALDYYLVTE
jgi:hypothetical protein